MCARPAHQPRPVGSLHQCRHGYAPLPFQVWQLVHTESAELWLDDLERHSAATTYSELYESPTADFFETDRLCLRLSESDRYATVQLVEFDDDRATLAIRA